MDDKNNKECKSITWKTSITALVISFWGTAGLECLFIWFGVVAFPHVERHPISYSMSIVGGLASLIAFILSLCVYSKIRKGNWTIKGVLADVLIILLSSPIFFFVFGEIYMWLQLLH